MKRYSGHGACITAGLLLAASGASAAVTFNFETANQYANNFSQIGGQFTPTQTTGQPNNYVHVAAAGSPTAQRATFVYDSTPADGATTRNLFHVTAGGAGVTASADAQFGIANASFGIYFINGADRTKAVLALFNVNSSSGAEASDNIRFTQPASTGWNPADNNATETNLSLTAASLADAGIPLNSFKTISATYGLDASSHIVLSMTAGTRTLTSAAITAMTGWSDVEIAFRVSPVGSTVDVDNAVIPVPEPAAIGLLGVASLGLIRRRRA